jgi:hypothetical protein
LGCDEYTMPPPLSLCSIRAPERWQTVLMSVGASDEKSRRRKGSASILGSTSRAEPSE